MKTFTHSLVLSLLAIGLATSAMAQVEVTVREANAVSQTNIDALIAAGTATQDDIDNFLIYEMQGESVEFTAVVLSDPYNSGLASWVGDPTNQPGRVHVYVRDTSAVTMGYGGMTTQLVDATADVQFMVVGNVYTIQGVVSAFAGTIQVNPTAFENLGPYEDLGLPDEIMDPVLVTTDDLNRVVTDPLGGTVVQINWANFNDNNSQYVRMEDALVTANNVNGGRYSYQWSSAGTEALVNSDDISLRFRNDRSGDPDYPNPPWNSHAGDDRSPPAIGAAINVQGYALYRGFDFTGSSSTPLGALMVVSPWEDEDLEISISPPIFGTVQGPTDVIGNEPVTISLEVTADPSRTITSVVLDYSSPNMRGGFGGSVNMVDGGGGVYSGDIPAAPDGAYVVFSITATDNVGGMSTTPEETYLVLYNGIEDISQIQMTADGEPGPTPFNGITTSNIDLDATVQADFFSGSTRYLILQDDPGLGEWTGIWARIDAGATVAVGDEINISASEIEDSFDLTRLDMPTFTVTGPGSPYPHKVLSTGVLNGDDPGFREAHEGLLVRFENVVITDANADGPDDGTGSNFGEWQFSSDGTEANEVRADDLSDAFASDYNLLNFMIGYSVTHIQGAWYYSFGNYKLVPVVADDIGTITTANEPVGPATPDTYRLHGAYPNPFNPSATIRYEIGAFGPVSLKIYDALGREVAVLVNETLAASTYEATFDASGLASGVYMYRLVAGNNVLTGSMTLLK